MANTWAENVHIGDELNLGDIQDAMVEQCSEDFTQLWKGGWIKVLGVQTDQVSNLTTFTLENEQGRSPMSLTITDSERVTVRRKPEEQVPVLAFPANRGAHLGLHAYLKSQELDREDYPFYALIATAMRRADSHNIEILKAGWPEVWQELNDRYNAPGGRLESDGR